MNRLDPVAEFAAHYDFGLDEFQLTACRELAEGRGVLVAAPTGSGKTIVGEFAVHRAIASGRKCFYTTPIKALSNQKYADLVARYGAERVGLLTGDNSVNGEAPIVVMTTEVLRNMLYAGSRTLTGLGYVVMDEVHYLADRMRGAVWEEVIIHLPDSVQVVSLSATVSNAEEFGEWLATVRGDTVTIVEEKRPVPLFQHVMVGKRLLDLFHDSDDHAAAGFVQEGAEVNRELLRVARDDWASSRMRDRRDKKGQRGRGNKPQGRRVYLPTRVDVTRALEGAGLLPAIVFIFSRAGCDAAVSQLLRAGIRLNSAAEREATTAFIEQKFADLPAKELAVLGYHDFKEALARGISAHHAGMLPVFKECVEELYLAGLCKIVFATETLALGINMPARTVVIEKLSKWNGETHADITPGEYTQLTGRAGRRGLDVEGHAVVLFSPGMNPREVAGLASTRTYPLRSSFRPSYNMAVNLVHQFGRDRARQLLESSFAQFQADKAVVGLARQLHKAEEALEGYRDAATCERGDFMAYAALRREISDLEKSASRARKQARRDDTATALAQLRPGDVISVPRGKYAGLAVVLDPGVGGSEGPRPLVLTTQRQAKRLAALDFVGPVPVLHRLRVPRNFNSRDPKQRRDLVSTLRNVTQGLIEPPPPAEPSREASPLDSERVAQLRAELTGHPCHDCPDRESHARWAERWAKLDRDAGTLKRRVEQRTNTIARQFDRVCEVLIALGYLVSGDGNEGGSGAGLAVSDQGRHLMRIYTDLDLVAAEALRLGLWDGLSPAELASVLSVLVFEARRADDGTVPRVPGGRVKSVISEMVRLWSQLHTLEREHRLDLLGEPDRGLAWAAYRWAEGDGLDEVLTESGMQAGDFVRWIKQLLDLTDQIADAAGPGALRKTARAASTAMRRGIVALATVPD